jgi:hypothetical protein
MMSAQYIFEFDRGQYHEIIPMIAWCREQFGHGGYVDDDGNAWFVQQQFGYTWFRFRNEQDAVLFSLKWAGQ